jgi:hypothetical protein
MVKEFFDEKEARREAKKSHSAVFKDLPSGWYYVAKPEEVYATSFEVGDEVWGLTCKALGLEEEREVELVYLPS